MKLFIKLLLITLSLVLTSCASYFLKKECEKTNWYQLGHDSAMRGERAASNPYIKKCEDVEALVRHDELSRGFSAGMGNYCKDDTAYKKGRNADTFNFNFCDSAKIKKLTANHAKGVNDLCTKDGYKFGAKGKVYNNVCPKALEADFLVKYKKGRIKYLKGEIKRARRAIRSAENEVYDLERDRNNLQSQLSMLPSGKIMKRERVYDAATNTYREETRYTEDEETKRKRSRIQAEISSVNNKINNSREKRRTLQNNISEFERALEELEG